MNLPEGISQADHDFLTKWGFTPDKHQKGLYHHNSIAEFKFCRTYYGHEFGYTIDDEYGWVTYDAITEENMAKAIQWVTEWVNSERNSATYEYDQILTSFRNLVIHKEPS
jgi:hypothetical protein